jgi:hypothetical protein
MLKKLFVAVLCAGLMAILGAQEAKALRLAGWPFLTYNTITCNSLWKGIGNADSNESYVQCDLLIKEVVLQCQNYGGGIGGDGNPFDSSNIVSRTSFLNGDLTGKGKTASNIKFEDIDIAQQLFGVFINNEFDHYEFPEEICDQNPNWSVFSPEEGGEVFVTKLYASVYGYKYLGADPDDEAHVYCELLEGNNGLYYSCTDCVIDETAEDGYTCDM